MKPIRDAVINEAPASLNSKRLSFRTLRNALIWVSRQTVYGSSSVQRLRWKATLVWRKRRVSHGPWSRCKRRCCLTVTTRENPQARVTARYWSLAVRATGFFKSVGNAKQPNDGYLAPFRLALVMHSMQSIKYIVTKGHKAMLKEVLSR